MRMLLCHRLCSTHHFLSLENNEDDVIMTRTRQAHDNHPFVFLGLSACAYSSLHKHECWMRALLHKNTSRWWLKHVLLKVFSYLPFALLSLTSFVRRVRFAVWASMPNISTQSNSFFAECDEGKSHVTLTAVSFFHPYTLLLVLPVLL